MWRKRLEELDRSMTTPAKVDKDELTGAGRETRIESLICSYLTEDVSGMWNAFPMINDDK